MKTDNNQLLSAILRMDFVSFIAKVFYTLNPGIQFNHNWHINLIADYLEEVRLGNIKRLIINIPPRMLKSTCISIAWPAWLLGYKSEYKIINISYSNILSTKHSLDFRLIINSSWYKNLFPKMLVTNNTKHKLSTSQNGFRFSTSVGGSLTGEGADILIIDDPHNPTYIHSDKMRKKVIDWYEQTLYTRLNNASQGSIIIIMQRLHINDLSGYLLNKIPNKWYLLKVPIIVENDQCYYISNKKYIFSTKNTLDKERITLEHIKNLKQELGNENFSAQYLQAPVEHKTGILSISDIHLCDELPKIFDWYCQSWDTAIKIGPKNDFSACTTWGIKNNKFYLIDVVKKKLIYPELKTNIKTLAEKFKAKIILIEDKANGQSLIQDLKEEGIHNVVAFKTRLDKKTRFITIIDFFYNKQVIIYKHIQLIDFVLLELTNFPKTDNDDIVDTISQFLHYIKSVTNKEIRIRNF